ncbi:MAG: RNA polymerase sigma factor, partial [Solirubrobacteraceae bacterium]
MSRLPPFQRFLDANADDVLRFLIASVGRHDADDAFQETFLSALRAYERLTPDSNLRGWVMTIAHRKALDIHRARARNPVPAAELEHHAGATDCSGGGAAGDHWDLVRALPPRQ